MKTLKIAAGIAVFFTLLCTPATTQSAAFRNGGFEQDLTGWKSGTFGNYTLPVISVEKGAAPEGSTAVKLTASDGNTRGWVEQRFAVQGGAAYIIEGNLKAANVTHNRFGIQVIEYPADSDAALTLDIKKTLPIQITKNTQDWTPYRAAVQTAPETATITVRVYLGTHGPVQKGAEAWADGITVTEQASGTAFNLLQNGSFEHKSAGNNAVWQGGSEPAQWTLWTAKGTAGVTAAFDTAEKQDGAHRIELVASAGGVSYVDDSKATNAHAARASLGAQSDGSTVWIVGGLAKGSRFEELVGDVVIGDDTGDLDSGVGVDDLGGHLEVHDVAGVVLDDVEDAGTAVDGGGGGDHLVGDRGGEDLSGAGGVEHAGAHEAAVEGLVPAASPGDDGDLALLLSPAAVDDVLVEVDVELVGVGGGHAPQGVRDHVVNGVDEFLHGADATAPRAAMYRQRSQGRSPAHIGAGHSGLMRTDAPRSAGGAWSASASTTTHRLKASRM